MRPFACINLISMVLALPGMAQFQSTNLHLRLERRTNTLDLVVDGAGDFGALLIYRAPDLRSLSTNPTVAVQTNTPLTNGLRFSLPAPGTASSKAFFAAAHFPGMVFIPPGPFAMGNSSADNGYPWEYPVHTIQVSGFCMDEYDVTKALWDEVFDWAIAHGYSFEYGARGKAANHPAQSMTWYDAVKWCNARSEKEGLAPAYYTDTPQTAVYRSGQVTVENGWVKWNSGYRLPTEAEWEKAARGGVSGQRFPWGNTISHASANYYGYPAGFGGQIYDLSFGFHPAYNDGVEPYTSPVGSFPANGYGLYDMAGNVFAWCWDRTDIYYYASSPTVDPRGPTEPTLGSYRVARGGSWYSTGSDARCAFRLTYGDPGFRYDDAGFRCVLAPVSAP